MMIVHLQQSLNHHKDVQKAESDETSLFPISNHEKRIEIMRGRNKTVITSMWVIRLLLQKCSDGY